MLIQIPDLIDKDCSVAQQAGGWIPGLPDRQDHRAGASKPSIRV